MISKLILAKKIAIAQEITAQTGKKFVLEYRRRGDADTTGYITAGYNVSPPVQYSRVANSFNFEPSVDFEFSIPVSNGVSEMALDIASELSDNVCEIVTKFALSDNDIEQIISLDVNDENNVDEADSFYSEIKIVARFRFAMMSYNRE